MYSHSVPSNELPPVYSPVFYQQHQPYHHHRNSGQANIAFRPRNISYSYRENDRGMLYHNPSPPPSIVPTRYSGASQQPNNSNLYYRLSYYGDLVDKDDLSDQMLSYGHPGEQNQILQQEDHVAPPEFRGTNGHLNPRSNGTIQQHTFTVRQEVPTPPPEEPESMTTDYPWLQENASEDPNTSQQNGDGQPDAAGCSSRFYQPDVKLNPVFLSDMHRDNANGGQHNRISLSPVSSASFQSTSPCFQNRQRQGRRNSNLPEVRPAPAPRQRAPDAGWSGATSNVPVKRKVVLHNDDDHATKLQKRLNRFGDFAELTRNSRRRVDEVSLDEIIRNKNIRKVPERHADDNHTTRRYFRRPPPPPPPPTAYTWRSGNGKSFSETHAPFRGESRQQNGGYGCSNNFDNRRAEGYHQFDRRNEPRPFGRGEFRNYDYRSGYPASTNVKRSSRNGDRESWSGQMRPVVIDGASVAFAYGEDLHFDCEGIQVCVDFFKNMNFKDITVVVPRDSLQAGRSKSGHVLPKLKRDHMLLYNWDRSRSDESDDKLLILDTAIQKGGIIVSNSDFHRLARFNPGLRRNLWNRVVKFEFNAATPKNILFPDIDTSGTGIGPTWSELFALN